MGTTQDLYVQLRLITLLGGLILSTEARARRLHHHQIIDSCLPEKIKFSLSFTNSQSLLKLMSSKLVMPSNHLILCRPLLLPPSIFPSISVFFNESALRIRWPKYWSFSFSISPSNEYSDTRLVRLEWRLTVVRKIMTLKCC